jgi:putative ABC transport system permease protein
METLVQDLRYGWRTLWKNPGITSVAVIALALGIGANSAIFSVVNAILLKPLNVPHPERIVVLTETRFGEGWSNAAPANFVAWRERNQVFENIAAYASQSYNLLGGDVPEQVSGARISASLFPMLFVKPALGRTFTPEEDQPGRERVVMLSHNLWQRRFNANPNVVNQTINLSGNSYTIVGVMPADFGFPNADTELWTPVAINDGTVDGMGGRIINVLARLKQGVTLGEARAEMNAIAQSLAQERPEFNAGWGISITPLQELVVGDVKRSLLVLLGAVSFVLLIACANVANLLLARAARRQREIAIRIALGASRLRLVRMLLTESMLLAMLGGALGLLLAVWGVDGLLALAPGNLPRVEEIGMDRWVFGYTMAVSLLTGIIFGLAPALQASKPNLNELLKEGIRSSPAGFGRDRLRSLLVVAEVALSLVLLIGAGLMMRSFARLQNVKPGFDPRNVVAMRVSLPDEKYAEDQSVVNFYEQAFARLKQLPGVKQAGAIHVLPWSGDNSGRYFHPEGQPMPQAGEEPTYNYRIITPGYFETMSIPLMKGRDFTFQDTAQAPGAVIVNEAMAHLFWPNQEAIGKRLKHRGRDEDPWLTVVGVVGNVRHGWLGDMTQPEIYLTYSQVPLLESRTIERHRRAMQIVIRTESDPMSIVPAARREVAALDAELPLFNIKTMDERLGYSLVRPRFNTLLMGIFAAVALVLAAVGLYGVMSYTVAQRTHEIGIRIALGARRQDVLMLVLRQGLMLILTGVVIGLIAALALTRFMSGLLYDLSARDPYTFVAISLLLVAIALLACYIPARRATRVEPTVALRYE